MLLPFTSIMCVQGMKSTSQTLALSAFILGFLALTHTTWPRCELRSGVEACITLASYAFSERCGWHVPQ
jgi:hypothetical protein